MRVYSQYPCELGGGSVVTSKCGREVEDCKDLKNLAKHYLPPRCTPGNVVSDWRANILWALVRDCIANWLAYCGPGAPQSKRSVEPGSGNERDPANFLWAGRSADTSRTSH